MSGHNKWSQIKRQKGVTDAKRSKIFTKLARLLALESRKASGNTSSPGLRTAIDKARAENMPSENIERAVKKGLGGESGGLEPITYEAYAPGGVGLIIETLSDNRNKTAQEIKFTLSEHGGNLGTMGSVTWAFEKTTEGWVPSTPVEIDQAVAEKLSTLIEALENLDDVQNVVDNAKTA